VIDQNIERYRPPKSMLKVEPLPKPVELAKRVGNVYLKTALMEATHAAARSKGTYLRDKFHRLKARRGYKRAAVAIAHKILVSIYHMLSQNVSYNDLGDLYLDNLNKHHLTRNLVRRLERLGYSVTVTLPDAAA
jgi:transposase